MTREHTVIGAKRVSATSALPMCYRNMSATETVIKHSHEILTIVSTHSTGEVLFKLWTWIVVFILFAVSGVCQFMFFTFQAG